MLRLLEATGLRPLVADTFALADARTAFERMASGDVVGKLVLTP
jgi:NADPH:quinone reductase-like Zn-dependent oxidoreductase